MTFISFPAGMARYPYVAFCHLDCTRRDSLDHPSCLQGKVLGENWKDLIQYNHEFLVVMIVVFVIIAAVLGFKYYRNRR